MENNSNYIRLVVHELRTPLTSIKAASDYLLRNTDQNLNDKQINFLKMIRMNCERVVKLTSDFSSLNKLENDLEVITLEPVKPSDFIFGALQDIKHRADEKRVTLNAGSLPDGHLISGNNFWLREVVYLILERAVAFTPSDKAVSLEAKTTRSVKKSGSGEGFLVITIIDESPGIEVAGQGDVFDKFADIFLGGESPQIKGSGLEFVICREIMRKLNGQFQIKTLPGRGNKFILHLPLAGKVSK